MGLSMFHDPIETVNISGWIFDACLIGVSHKTAEINSIPLYTAD